jgi:predicted nucleic acid-binding protein
VDPSTRSPRDRSRFSVAHEGEAEAIALALAEKAQVVLLDEKDARQAGRRVNLHVLGSVGVLIWAKRIGVLASLRQELDALRKEGFRLNQSLYDEALRLVDEVV